MYSSHWVLYISFREKFVRLLSVECNHFVIIKLIWMTELMYAQSHNIKYNILYAINLYRVHKYEIRKNHEKFQQINYVNQYHVFPHTKRNFIPFHNIYL